LTISKPQKLEPQGVVKGTVSSVMTRRKEVIPDTLFTEQSTHEFSETKDGAVGI
jgi:hypothetical protein